VEQLSSGVDGQDLALDHLCPNAQNQQILGASKSSAKNSQILNAPHTRFPSI